MSGVATAQRDHRVFVGLIVLVLAVRYWLLINLPLTLLADAIHDDALFMRLGSNLARGVWLGGYDQFTLMKGPGYPAFLALSSVTGLPVTHTHALFQSVAMLAAGWCVLRLTGSRAATVILVALMALHPAGFVEGTHRVIRDQLFWAQIVLCAALAFVLFLAPPARARVRLALAVVLGLLAGWAWLTREEGIAFLPSLAVLALGVAVLNWRETAKTRRALAGFAVTAAAFALVPATFIALNWAVYGFAVGVDFKERNFVRALDALYAIDTGPVRKRVPVPFAAQRVAADASPSAAPLMRELHDGELGANWSAHSCNINPETCGEIGGGWFMWGLRDAAFFHGFYKDPATASRRFGQVADELESACETGRIKCRERSLYFIPSLSGAAWHDLPAVIGKITAKTVFGNRDAGAGMVTIVNETTWRVWSFVNYPRITPGRSASGAITVTGWFRDEAGGDFPEISAESRSGSKLESTFERVESPDLAAHFDDPALAENRFIVRFFCPNECKLVASRPGIAPLRVDTGAAPRKAAQGTSQLFVEKVEGAEVAINAWQGPAEMAARAIRDALLAIYTVLAPFVMGLGVLGALAACLHAAFSRSSSLLLVAALTAWSVVVVRIVMLALVDVSAFSGTALIYSLPSIYMALFASVISILSALRDIEQGRAW